MPVYSVKGPDGRTFKVNTPEGASSQDAIRYIYDTQYGRTQPASQNDYYQQLYGAGQPVEQPEEKPLGGFWDSLFASAKTLGLADEAAVFAANPTEENRKALLAAGESKFRGVGFGEGENWAAFKQLLGGSLGFLVAPAVAATAGSLATPFVGIAAGATTIGSQYEIENIRRQAEEQERALAEGRTPEEFSLGKATAAAAGSTALDVVGFRVLRPLFEAFPLVRNLVGGSDEAAEVLTDAARSGTLTFAGGIAKGAGKGVLFEVPQEVAQTALERWQAGLSLTDEEARGEFKQAAIGAAILGPLMGGVSGAAEVRTAQQRAAEEAEERAAQDTQQDENLLAVDDDFIALYTSQDFPYAELVKKLNLQVDRRGRILPDQVVPAESLKEIEEKIAAGQAARVAARKTRSELEAQDQYLADIPARIKAYEEELARQEAAKDVDFEPWQKELPLTGGEAQVELPLFGETQEPTPSMYVPAADVFGAVGFKPRSKPYRALAKELGLKVDAKGDLKPNQFVPRYLAADVVPEERKAEFAPPTAPRRTTDQAEFEFEEQQQLPLETRVGQATEDLFGETEFAPVPPGSTVPIQQETPQVEVAQEIPKEQYGMDLPGIPMEQLPPTDRVLRAMRISEDKKTKDNLQFATQLRPVEILGALNTLKSQGRIQFDPKEKEWKLTPAGEGDVRVRPESKPKRSRAGVGVSVRKQAPGVPGTQGTKPGGVAPAVKTPQGPAAGAGASDTALISRLSTQAADAYGDDVINFKVYQAVMSQLKRATPNFGLIQRVIAGDKDAIGQLTGESKKTASTAPTKKEAPTSRFDEDVEGDAADKWLKQQEEGAKEEKVDTRKDEKRIKLVEQLMKGAKALAESGRISVEEYEAVVNGLTSRSQKENQKAAAFLQEAVKRPAPPKKEAKEAKEAAPKEEVKKAAPKKEAKKAAPKEETVPDTKAYDKAYDKALERLDDLVLNLADRKQVLNFARSLVKKGVLEEADITESLLEKARDRDMDASDLAEEIRPSIEFRRDRAIRDALRATAKVTFTFRNKSGEIETKTVSQDVSDEYFDFKSKGYNLSQVEEELVDRLFYNEVNEKFDNIIHIDWSGIVIFKAAPKKEAAPKEEVKKTAPKEEAAPKKEKTQEELDAEVAELDRQEKARNEQQKEIESFARRSAQNAFDSPNEHGSLQDTIDTLRDNIRETLKENTFGPDSTRFEDAAFAAFDAEVAKLLRPEWATTFEKDTNGKIVYADAHVALLQGVSVLNGQPVYVGIHKTKGRTKVDIKNFTGDAFTEEEKKRLLAARERTEKEDADNAKRKPNGPFTDATSNVVGSDSVKKKYVEFLADLMKNMGMQEINVFLFDSKDLRRNEAKYNLYGGWRSALSAGIDPNEMGSTRPFGPKLKDFYISIDSTFPEELALEIISHELGHIIERVAYNNAPPETKKAIEAEFRAWLEKVKGKDGREMIEALRNRRTAEVQSAIIGDKQLANLEGYWKSFGEWFADNTSKWVTTSEKPLNVVDKFFSELAKKLRQLVGLLTGNKFVPAKSVKEFLDNMGSLSTSFAIGAWTSEKLGGPTSVSTKTVEDYLAPGKYVYHNVRNKEDIQDIVDNGLLPGTNVSLDESGQAFDDNAVILVFRKEDVDPISKKYQNDGLTRKKAKPIAILTDTTTAETQKTVSQLEDIANKRLAQKETLEKKLASYGVDESTINNYLFAYGKDAIEVLDRIKESLPDAVTDGKFDRVKERRNADIIESLKELKNINKAIDSLVERSSTAPETAPTWEELSQEFQKYGLPVQRFVMQEISEGVYVPKLKGTPTTSLDSDLASFSLAPTPAREQREAGRSVIRQVGNIPNNLPAPTTRIKDGSRAAMQDMPRWLRRGAYSFQSLHQLADMYRKFTGALDELWDLENKDGAKLRRRQDLISKNLQKWNKIMSRFSPTEKDRIYDLFMKTTTEQIEVLNAGTDPVLRRAGVTWVPRTIWSDPIRRQFDALPDDVKELYRDLRLAYHEYATEMEESLKQYLAPTEWQKLQTQILSKRLPVYLPLFRSGEHHLSYTDRDGEHVFRSFETINERTAAKAELTRNGAKDFKETSDIEQTLNNIPPSSFYGKIVGQLRKSRVDEKVIGELFSLYMEYLPTKSVLQMRQRRKGTIGFENDVLRAYATVGTKYARRLNRMEFLPKMTAAYEKFVADMGQGQYWVEYEDQDGKSVIKGFTTSELRANAIQRALSQGAKRASFQKFTLKADEIADLQDMVTKQLQYYNAPNRNNIADFAGYFSYLMFMGGNISSAVIDTTHIPMVVYSILQGRYGIGNAFAALSNANVQFFNKRGLPNDLKRMLERAENDGIVGEFRLADLTEFENPENKALKVKAAVDNAVNYVFTKSDKYQRETTFLAAYQLAEKARKKEGKTGRELEEAAYNDAKRILYDAYGSAFPKASAAIMQHGLARLALTFKRFAINRMWLLYKAFREAAKDQPKEVRNAARQQLIGYFGMAYLFAGVQGMPLVGWGEAFAAILNGMFGDDDEPYDPKNALRQAIGTFNFKGPVNAMLGVDIASRSGWDNMIWRDDPRRVAEVGPVTYAFEQLFGPMYSYMVNVPKAMEHINEGRMLRGLDMLAPRVVGNPIKAYRYAVEGATTKDGIPVVDDVNTYNQFMQALGFAPAELANAYAEGDELKTREGKIKARATALRKRIMMSIVNKDDEAKNELLAEMRAFNAKHPGAAITSESIREAVTRHHIRLSQSVSGVVLAPKLKRPVMEELGYEEEEEE